MNKATFVLTATLSCLTLPALSALAGPATDALVTCMADNTTGKDRKEMARWIFATMSAHPEILSLANVTDENRDRLDKGMAALVTRLLTEDCLDQTKIALQKENSQEPVKTAFGAMGGLAMQELMSNAQVNAAATGFAKYLDAAKLNAAFSTK